MSTFQVLDYWRPDITTVANAYGLDSFLVEAIVWQESRGCADAFRHEPDYWLRYLSKHPDYAGQNPRRVASSYGLMQLMLPTAREVGFVGEPEELFLPKNNLHFGCRHLRSLADWAAGYEVSTAVRLRAILAAWNGGKGGNVPGHTLRPTPARYADRVLATLNELHG